VLNEVDYLDDILAKFVDVGVSGATICTAREWQAPSSTVKITKSHSLAL